MYGILSEGYVFLHKMIREEIAVVRNNQEYSKENKKKKDGNMQKERLYLREEYIKKIENNGIVLSELIKFVLNKWKIILILCAVFFLGCVVITFLGEDKTEDVLPQEELGAQLTEIQQKKVNDIIIENEKINKDLEVLEEYEDTLAYMNIDAYKCHVNTLQYLINSEELGGEIYEAYRTYTISGLKEIIDDKLGGEFVNPSDLVIEIGNGSQVDNQAIFKDKKSYVLVIKVVAADADMNTKLTDVVRNALEEYHKRLNSVMGKHELILLSESSYVGNDEGTKQKQIELEEKIKEKKDYIINNENLLNEDEKMFLEQLKDKDNNNIKDEPVVSVKKQGKSIVWYVMALIICVILSCIIVACYYIFIFGNRLNDSEEIMTIFDLPYIGEVSKRNLEADVSELKDEIKSMCLESASGELFVSVMTNMGHIEDYFDKIKNELVQYKMKLLFGNNISEDFESMKTARRCKNMILIFEEGKTRYKSIDSVLQRCDNWGINIIGVINIKK